MTAPFPHPWRDALVPGAPREALEAWLPAWLQSARWFGAKARTIARCEIEELIALPPSPDTGAGEPPAHLAMLRVEFADEGEERYALPLQIGRPGETPAEAIVLRTADGRELIDAVHSMQFRDGWMRLIARGDRVEGAAGTLVGVPGKHLPAGADSLQSRVLRVEQSNSSVIYGDHPGASGQLFVKLFRKLEDGMNPDVELTRFLAEEQGFQHVPPFAGTVEYRRAGHEPRVLALALGMVPNEGDAWSCALREVRHCFARVTALPPPVAGWWASGPSAEPMRIALGPWAARAEQLGRRTAQMHLALSAATEDSAFAGVPLSWDDATTLAAAIRTSGDRVWNLLRASKAPSPAIAELLALEPALKGHADRIESGLPAVAKTRTHGDYHLGQVLSTGTDFVIIDFEGEPLRSLAERREKRSPLRDVAGMLRSFDYASHSVLAEMAGPPPALHAWAEAWTAETCRLFLQAWLATSQGSTFLPSDPARTRSLLDAFLLEKALYEVAYELNNRPSWVPIPARGLAALLRR